MRTYIRRESNDAALSNVSDSTRDDQEIVVKVAEVSRASYPNVTLRPDWVRWSEALRLFAHGATVRAAWRIAAIVGTLLSVVNQGGILLSGQATRLTLVRIAVNYATPFTVSSLGYLLACRRPPAATSRPISQAEDGQPA